MSASAEATGATALGHYETTIITNSAITDENLGRLRERLTQIVLAHNGKVVCQEDWGRRKLAYPIKKEGRGQFTYMVFSGDAGVVPELERNLRIHESVLRFLTVRMDKRFDPEKFEKPVPFGKKDKEGEGFPERKGRGESRGYESRGERY